MRQTTKYDFAIAKKIAKGEALTIEEQEHVKNFMDELLGEAEVTLI